MKVLFDNQLFSWQRYGGASKYFVMLLNAMPRDIWDTTTVFSNNEYLRALDLFKVRHFLPGRLFRGQGLIMHTLNKPYSLYRLRRRDYDVYHQTHFDPFGLKAIGTKPMVTTFHDTNFSTLAPNPKVVEWQRKSLKRADAVIAISENTRHDLLNLFDIDPAKVTVIHHGVYMPARGSKPIEPSLFDFPYILYVGSRADHKNFDSLAKAFAIFTKQFPEVRLVCTWMPFSKHEKSLFHQLGISEKVILFSADEEEMKRLYKNALFYIFPSLYEGFGMPILEAMAYNCPVVLSDASCFPEIAADAAEYFDPTDIGDMADTMIRVASSDSLRDDLRRRGSIRVADFSWEKCARQHIEVYKSLTGS